MNFTGKTGKVARALLNKIKRPRTDKWTPPSENTVILGQGVYSDFAENTLVVGWSHSRKWEHYILPNALQMNTNMVIAEPGGGILNIFEDVQDWIDCHTPTEARELAKQNGCCVREDYTDEVL